MVKPASSSARKWVRISRTTHPISVRLKSRNSLSTLSRIYLIQPTKISTLKPLVVAALVALLRGEEVAAEEAAGEADEPEEAALGVLPLDGADATHGAVGLELQIGALGLWKGTEGVRGLAAGPGAYPRGPGACLPARRSPQLLACSSGNPWRFLLLGAAKGDKLGLWRSRPLVLGLVLQVMERSGFDGVLRHFEGQATLTTD
ncbi:hypothetical protein Zmor_022706 [Zophobas morio]|uniref:Uncharacterized protein n=1 Tax=Zophobas morio TaxID=2755281 RepID=A0AA38HVT7_9CUCU|nr:hypothetical protein Zmor_022706 [Zophobas morio]